MLLIKPETLFKSPVTLGKGNFGVVGFFFPLFICCFNKRLLVCIASCGFFAFSALKKKNTFISSVVLLEVVQASQHTYHWSIRQISFPSSTGIFNPLTVFPPSFSRILTLCCCIWDLCPFMVKQSQVLLLAQSQGIKTTQALLEPNFLSVLNTMKAWVTFLAMCAIVSKPF